MAMANNDFWTFPMNITEPSQAEVEEGARFVMSFTQFQRVALKKWLMGLALSWPMKYAAIMAHLKAHDFVIAVSIRQEHAAAEARVRYRGARERDLISKLIKGPIARKNKNFFTKCIALDERGRARLLPKNETETVAGDVEGRDPMAAGSRDPIPFPVPFRDDSGLPIDPLPSTSDNNSVASMSESERSSD
jgi:hypothetical protein